jgi:hypothetical protein
MLNIIASKPKYPDATDAFDRSLTYIVARRKNGEYVSATASPQSLASGEWFWGHYFPSVAEALAHFNAR